jgi:hypothetical protein
MGKGGEGMNNSGLLDRLGAAFALADFLQAGEILPEVFAFENAVLQAGKVGRQFRSRFGGQRVHPPCAADLYLHHSMATQIRELLGSSHRADAEHLLNVANTLRLNAQEIENPQTIDVAQALVDRDDLL